ncbi:MAG: transporter related protein [Frankiales bacterium]|nr:transporter related protein [Frankiales bacterium]
MAAVAGLVLVILLVVSAVAFTGGSSTPVAVSSRFITATPESDGTQVQLDTSFYLPVRTPAPAILLATGFGGTKPTLDAYARVLARHGYTVLTFSPRGFGASSGLIHMDSLQYEIADGARLLDWLQTRPEVSKRADGTPIVGVAGASYGGAFSLMLGATDHRIAAVAADITWNDLGRSLFADLDGALTRAGTTATGGVLKKLWTGTLFATGASARADGCGRFAADICALYRSAATSGELSSRAQRSLLSESSPASVLDQMQAPTLLTQGEQDSLFPLSEADANARQIAAAGAPVQVRWRPGGHDAPAQNDDVAGWQRQFFDAELRGIGPNGTSFELSQRGASLSSSTGRRVDVTLRDDAGYPGIDSRPGFQLDPVTVAGSAQTVVAPPGGSPAAVTVLPGLSDLLSAASDAGIGQVSSLSRVRGQTAVFASAPLSAARLVVGSSSITLAVQPLSGGARTATLFVSLHDLAPDGTDTLPVPLVSPIKVPVGGSGSAAAERTVQLPWIVASIPVGHRLGVEVSTTDFAYAMPEQPATYRISLAAPVLQVSGLAVHSVGNSSGVWAWLIVAGIVVAACVLVLLIAFVLRRPGRRRGARLVAAELETDVPVVVTDLVKQYRDGYRAVNGVSFRVERGQVVGLLGPNGAGKTTTLRMLMGLILPTAGTIQVFGTTVRPGDPVLARLGAFVEGPGLLPHLTGAENLRLYWAASGRPIEAARLDTVLEIAGLGDSLARRVKTYSHGMQQRLAIAQAMLGLPDVLVLDEPTNGLDPPQIAEMREVLHSYAGTGRTVIVSSHLLSEVEQTCTHVVVMHRGRVLVAGSVAEVAGTSTDQLAVADPDAAQQALAAAGLASQRVPASRALETVFLDLIGERHD